MKTQQAVAEIQQAVVSMSSCLDSILEAQHQLLEVVSSARCRHDDNDLDPTTRGDDATANGDGAAASNAQAARGATDSLDPSLMSFMDKKRKFCFQPLTSTLLSSATSLAASCATMATSMADSNAAPQPLSNIAKSNPINNSDDEDVDSISGMAHKEVPFFCRLVKDLDRDTGRTIYGSVQKIFIGRTSGKRYYRVQFENFYQDDWSLERWSDPVHVASVGAYSLDELPAVIRDRMRPWPV